MWSRPTLSFTALGVIQRPITYQWRFQQQRYSGGDEQCYTITRLGVTNHGAYQVVLNDGARSVTSDAAT